MPNLEVMSAVELFCFLDTVLSSFLYNLYHTVIFEVDHLLFMIHMKSVC